MGNQRHLTSYSVPEGEESKGGFGKVWKVRDKKYKIEFALKEMAKVKVIDKKSEKSIKAEREFLQKLKHPFIVNMHSAFQDYEHLYLVMDLLNGGDLRYHLSRKKRFKEEQTKFFIACIMIGLQYIHSKNILHRDIKPENLVLDDSGYVHITDFGVAKYYSLNNSHETSGTPGYMSPEVMRGQNHSYSVDFYAVGVIAFEFMTGKRPYLGKSRKEIKEQIMATQVEVRQSNLPEGWSKDSADFINQLIQRKQESRLGHKSIKEIFDHPWLSSFPFQMLLNKEIDSTYIPEKKDNFDKKYCEGIEKLGLETNNRYDKIFENSNFTHLFEKFTYYGRDNDEEYNSNKKKTSYYNSFINKAKGNSGSVSDNHHNCNIAFSANKKRCQSTNVNDIKIIETFTSGFYLNKNHQANKEIKKTNINKIPCPSISSTTISRSNNKHNSTSLAPFYSFKRTAGLNKNDDFKGINKPKASSMNKTIRINSETIIPHSRGGRINASSKSQNTNISFQRSNSNIGENTRGATIVTRNTNNNISNALSSNTPHHSINTNTNNHTHTNTNINNRITKRNKIALTSVASLSANSLNNPNTSIIVAANANCGSIANNYSVSSNSISTHNNTTKPYTKKQAISKSSNSFLTIKINSITTPTAKAKK